MEAVESSAVPTFVFPEVLAICWSFSVTLANRERGTVAVLSYSSAMQSSMQLADLLWSLCFGNIPILSLATELLPSSTAAQLSMLLLSSQS